MALPGPSTYTDLEPFPNVLGLPVCSAYGSPQTTWMQNVPHFSVGLPSFGHSANGAMVAGEAVYLEGDFHPTASSYWEQRAGLPLLGVLLWGFAGMSALTFFFVRYYLGLCGEPIPTVARYSPTSIFMSMATSWLCLGCLAFSGAVSIIVSSTTLTVGYETVLSAGAAIEARLRDSFNTGRELLKGSLGMLAELDAFAHALAATYNATLLADALTCWRGVLEDLPSAGTLLAATRALRLAYGSLAADAVTGAAFSQLGGALEVLPSEVTNVIETIRTLEDAAQRRLPSLLPLAAAVEQLNVSVGNLSSVPDAIIDGLSALNASYTALPSLPAIIAQLGRVHHGQALPHICASIPLGWSPGDQTECDVLRAQLSAVGAVLDASAPAETLAELRTQESLLDTFPDLERISAELVAVESALGGFPNMTFAASARLKLNSSLAGWRVEVIDEGMAAMTQTTALLHAARIESLYRPLELHIQLLPLLGCGDDLLAQLERLNASALQIPQSSQQLHELSTQLLAALRDLSAPAPNLAGALVLTRTLAALPDLEATAAAVRRLDAAVSEMPPAEPLIEGYRLVEAQRTPSEAHDAVVNQTLLISDAIAALPDTAALTAHLLASNASRAALPPLIEETLAAIARYDETGDNTAMQVLPRTLAELTLLQAELEWRASASEEMDALETALGALSVSMAHLPETQPLISHLEILDATLAALPDLQSEQNRSEALLAAALAAPDAETLAEGWRNLTGSVESLMPLLSTETELAQYALVQAAVPVAAGALVEGTLSLHAVLGSVEVLTAAGKSAVLAVEAQADSDLYTLEGAFLDGRNGSGYIRYVAGWRSNIESGWYLFSMITFGVPIGVAAIAAASALLRRGYFALHAGHALLLLLPWVLLLALTLELPLAALISDGCEHMEYFVERRLAEMGIDDPSFELAREPVAAFMDGCVEGSALGRFFEPIRDRTGEAQRNVTGALGELQLRPGIEAGVARLVAQSEMLETTLVLINEAMACGEVHKLYLDAKAGLCCDIAYAVTFQWIARLCSAFVIIPGIVGAIAGYKRFRRKLWGPYATAQALEIGAYL